MSDVGAQSIVVLFWGMLLAGAGLSGFGLFRALARYRARRAEWDEEEGDIVIGDGKLVAGQSLTLMPGKHSASPGALRSLEGSIVEISRKHCVIALDSKDAARLRGSRSALAPAGIHGDLPGVASWPCRGEEITVSVTAATAVYRFTTRVGDVSASENGTRLIISRPGILARIQRRRHARVALNAPAAFERVLSAQPPSQNRGGTAPRGAILHGSVRDLSGGGLRANIGGLLRLSEIDSILRVFEPGATVQIGLQIPALPQSGVLARVRTSGRAVTLGGLTVYVAFEFLPMPVWEREIVIQHVFQLQREQLRATKLRRHGGQPGLCQ